MEEIEDLEELRMKQRIISIIVALGIIIPLIILGNIFYAFGIAIIALVAYKELVEIDKDKKEFPDFVKCIGGILLIMIIFSNYSNNILSLTLNYKVLTASILVLLLPIIVYNNNKKYNATDALYLLGGTLLLGLFFNLLISIRSFDVKYLIFLILITTMTDTFALIFGMLIGKHKFAPDISPKKSWEGAIMGSLMGTLIVGTYYFTAINPDAPYLSTILIILLLTFIGQLGDLIFSAIKRQHGIKDFSNIMPGHGGILDRLDSLIFVVYAFILLASYL